MLQVLSQASIYLNVLSNGISFDRLELGIPRDIPEMIEFNHVAVI